MTKEATKAAPKDRDQVVVEAAGICRKDCAALLDEHLAHVFKDAERQHADGGEPEMQVQFCMIFKFLRDPRRVEVKTDLTWATRVKRDVDGFGGTVSIEPDLFTPAPPPKKAEEGPWKQLRAPRKMLAAPKGDAP